MSGRRAVWRQLRSSRLSSAVLAVLLLLGLVALAADLIASDLPVVLRWDGQTHLLPGLSRPAELRTLDNQQIRRALSARPERGWAWMPLCEYGPLQHPEILSPPPAAPNAHHWLGTDDRGRDIFARLVHGTRVSFTVGFASVAISVLLGLLLGVVSGYLGGRADFLVSRLIEIGLTFPTFFLILIVMGLLEQSSIWMLVLVIGLTRWTDTARLARAEVLKLRGQAFVDAARCSGAGALRIMMTHLVPNALGPVLVNAAFGVSSAILIEASLSFLGFGAPPPTPSWGEVLSQAMEHQDRWWLTLCPGLLLFLTLTSLNVLSEGLRDALDPRLREP